jgi:hypothetical protein
MGSIKGKLEVDLYANPDPMVQGFMKGEQAAKRASGSIGESIDKINKKQIKAMTGNLLGGLGIIGAIDAGAKIANDLVKGFQDGSIKGLGGAFEHIGNSLAEFAKNLPAVGAVGELIARTIVDPLTGGTMAQEDKQIASRAEFAKKSKAAEDKARIDKQHADADAEMAKKLAEPGIKAAAEEQKIREKLDAQQKSSLKEIQEIKDDLRHATMSERDIEIERIQALPQLLQRQKDEAIAIYDQLQATKARIDAEKQLAETKAKAHQDDISNFAKAQEQQDKAAEDYKTKLEENKQQAAMASTNTDVSTALGSIKVAGTSTMNTQKIAEDSLAVERKQLDEAVKQTTIFKQLMGAP